MRSFWIYLAGMLAFGSINAQDIMYPSETSDRFDQESVGDCFTPARERGQCILLKSCQSLKELSMKTPLSSKDRDFLRRSQCGTQGVEMKVCCTLASKGVSTIPPVKDTANGANLLPAPGTCGVGYGDKLIGGKITQIGEFPWMALLNYEKPAGRKGFHCGGVVINERYVLTASHCVNGKAIPSDWRLSSVRLGEWDTTSETDCDGGDCNEPPVDIAIEELIPHENYQPGMRNQAHDIALLRLSTPINYSEWIKPICLPLDQHLQTANFEGARLDVAGWGKTENASRSNIQLKATFKVTNLSACQEIYRPELITLQDTQLCAGGEKGVDSCSGDSGGPLMGIDVKNRTRPFFFLAGLVSFGPSQCGKEGWPGVYTRVGSYVDWIQRKIRP